jgi:RNA polymerase sigma factor (sigma-70 family)
MNDKSSESSAVASPATSEPVATVRAPLGRAEREAMMKDAECVVRAFVLKSAIRPSQKDDAIQDVMLTVWEKTLKFDPALGVKWTTYVVGIARRTITRQLSRATKEPVQAEQEQLGTVPDRGGEDREAGQHDADGGDCDSEDRESEIAGALREAVRLKLSEPILDRLTPKLRQLVEMVAFEGLTPEQVAIRLGYPVKAVKINLQAAVRRMLGQVPCGSKGDHDRRAARELLAELATANPTWTANRLHSELAEFIPIGVVDRLIQKMKRAATSAAAIRNEPAPVALAG